MFCLEDSSVHVAAYCRDNYACRQVLDFWLNGMYRNG